MQTYAAVFRIQDKLETGCAESDKACKEMEEIGISDRSMIWNTDLVETLELQNLVVQAAQTMYSAEARTGGVLRARRSARRGPLASRCRRARSRAAHTRATTSTRATTRIG